MKSKEEILFSYMDESLQVSTESQLKAMQEYAEEMAVEVLGKYIGGITSKYELKRVVKELTNENH